MNKHIVYFDKQLFSYNKERGIEMKNNMKKITALMIAFLVVGCGPVNNDAKSEQSEQPTSAQKEESSKGGDKTSSQQGGGTTSQQQGGHKYASTWSYDDEIPF